MPSERLEVFDVDPLFPGRGKVYKAHNGFFFNEVNGGQEQIDWLDKNFVAKSDDLYVISYPKTGTTWAQELVYVINENLNFEKAAKTDLNERFPYIENKFSQKFVSSSTSPRYLKSHFPYSLLPDSIIKSKAKIIYTIRNPKDTLISFYYFCITNKRIDYQGDLETFFSYFIEDKLEYSPYWKHVLEYWERKDEDNILILCYEDMKKDIHREIQRIASFIEKDVTSEEVELIADYCSFHNMKKNPAANHSRHLSNNCFIRKGEVGDWKHYFTKEMNEKMDDYVDKHFHNSGLKFQYE